MQVINPRFTLARRRARRFDHPVFESPRVTRKGLKPKVQIGSKRDPLKPIELMPAIHTPQRAGGDGLIGAFCAIGLVGVFVALAMGY